MELSPQNVRKNSKFKISTAADQKKSQKNHKTKF